jgi:heptosyltransferase-2
MIEIKKVLFITLSNIGDAVLTLPALDSLRDRYPEAKITVMSAERTKGLFENSPYIDRLIVFDKCSKLSEKIKLFHELKKERFDVVVDLRNSFFGAFLPARQRILPSVAIPNDVLHMKDRHLYKVKSPCLAGRQEKSKVKSQEQIPGSLYIRPQDEQYIDKILQENKITGDDRLIIISPGARSHIKRWPQDKFVDLISYIAEEFKIKIILVGDKDDTPIAGYIAKHSQHPVIDLSGKTSIAQLCALLKRAGCVITNDSAVLHLASYLDVPIVSIFGPTSEVKYGPWSDICAIVKKDIFCRPCEKAQCRFGSLKCLHLIKVEDVVRQLNNILTIHHLPSTIHQVPNFKRILIVRTDRIGDVLLSTPVIKALRDEYPSAYIAMMVSPYARDIVDGNPYVDEVIIYDKDGKHKSWQRSMKFAHNLKKKRFDLAIILHPTNRVHLVTFFAGIKRRIGYDRKLGILLTDRIRHTKQLGEKHESEYNLDLIRYLGIEPKDKSLFMPITRESQDWMNELSKQEGIKNSDKLLAIHPGASCPSKIWPNERFAEVADKLADKYGFKVLVIAGPKDIALAKELIKHMHWPAIDLAGKISVAQLASALKRCALFISNDSGPVHIASAVGTPVISIFGRKQGGLSPQRWGPLGSKGRILHKDAGCIRCLAHNCIKEFACLKAIQVSDVLNAADSILKNYA